MFSKIIQWLSTPQTSKEISRQNFINVQVDAIGVGLASAANAFLPVFLLRLNANNNDISLLTAMPAVAGFLLAIPLGRVLRGQRHIVPWFSASRLATIAGFFLTGLVSLVLPDDLKVAGVLIVWALVTIPQAILNICFSMVMNAVAGPSGRFELMSRRWSILGVTTSLSVFLVGQMLERIAFPFNFQAMFLFLSLGGLLSYYFSSHITIPDNQPLETQSGISLSQSLRNYFSIMKVERGFLPFITKRFVFMTGVTLAAPLFPIYFVKDLSAANDMIATLATAESASLVVGYFFWVRFSRGSGSRKILLASTLGLVLYPLLTSFTHDMQLIALYAAVSGFFTAGLNLVFFDELLKRVPLQYSATLISFAQSFQYLSSIIAPFIGTLLAAWVGVGPALLFSAGLRLVGFALFALDRPQKTE